MHSRLIHLIKTDSEHKIAGETAEFHWEVFDGAALSDQSNSKGSNPFLCKYKRNFSWINYIKKLEIPRCSSACGTSSQLEIFEGETVL